VKAAPAKWSRPAVGPNSTISDAFARLCTAALAQVAANAPGVARGADPEYLHQLRVGARRFLSAMRTFRPLLKRTRAKALAGELRDAMQVFGTARDWDVFVVTLQSAAPSKALASSAARRRAAAIAQARALAGSPEFREIQHRARRWLDEDPWRISAQPERAVLAFACNALDRARRRLGKRAADIDWRDRRQRHRVRIALKRLRYSCDSFADCFPARRVGPFLTQLGALQDTLGELNDLAVARALVGELQADGKRVRAMLAQRERNLIASLAREWAAFTRMRPYWQRAAAPGAER